jgi:sterol desaturase/sphingolipid hydroxylase (fatty acid hydroxylase superfamily)
MDFLVWAQKSYAPAALLYSWGAIVGSYFLFHLVERMWPAERNQRYSGIFENVKITAIFLLMAPIPAYFAGILASHAAQYLGGPLFSFQLNGYVSDKTGIARLALILPLAAIPALVLDFFYYWFHRLQHTLPWLWEQHKLHHTEVVLNVTSSYRHHWLENTFRAFVIVFPMALLIKITPVEAGLASVLTTQLGYFIHANIRLQLGPLSRFIGCPQVHRIHHSVEAKHYNRNFAAYFPMWDVIFGTYYHPHGDEFPATGISGEPAKQPMKEVLWGPFFAWKRMMRRPAKVTNSPH